MALKLITTADIAGCPMAHMTPESRAGLTWFVPFPESLYVMYKVEI